MTRETGTKNTVKEPVAKKRLASVDGMVRVKRPVKPAPRAAEKPASKPSVKPAAPKKPVTPKKLAVAAEKPVKSPENTIKSEEKPLESPKRPIVSSRGRFIDFVPKGRQNAPRRPQMAVPSLSDTTYAPEEEPEISVKRTTIAEDYDMDGEPDAVTEVETVEISQKEVPETEPQAELPVSAAPRRRHFSHFVPQMDFVFPRRHKNTPEEPAEQEEPELAEPDEPEAEEEPVITPVRPAAISRPAPKVEARPRATAPEVTVRHTRVVATTDDDLPPVNEDDLAAALAGFADDNTEGDAPVLTDRLSKEAADFAEEIDALDELSDEIFGEEAPEETKEQIEEMEDFVSEPKPLFEEKGEPKKRGLAGDYGAATGAYITPGSNSDPLVKDRKVREREERRAERAAEKAMEKAAKQAAARGAATAPYVLGSRSPFLTSVSVEKRPLSSRTPEDYAPLESRRATPVKNTYPAKKRALSEPAPEAVTRRQTLVVSTPEVKRSPALIIAIILTILLGAGVGALAYMIFFQS